MNVIEIFGANVKKLRLRSGMSQKEVGMILGGVSYGAVGKIERGENKSLPSKEQIVALARRFDVRPEDLLGSDQFVTSRYTDHEVKLMEDHRSTVYIKAALAKMEADLAMKAEWSAKSEYLTGEKR